ncbi:family 43 glycosylhydrolase [Sphingobium sp. BYY-5]|uniref:family 43 glycosylhydrolase n=1 Tax=Sphingobium sp. BYY-5 TaxID=2926400 RepID=UPI001FA7A3D4|nr:family 43 glycosylhydrolase [Sphingobium sp. BYY-5]MCI4590730.1 family 43 glycosylhydrolase [Sphingobium sp. BYY-5]
MTVTRSGRFARTLLLAMIAALAGAAPAAAPATDPFAPHARNPLLPGYAADPSIVHYRGEWFIFVTIDPWGGEKLGLWRSRNFRDWTFSTPNWPTKAAAHSTTSGGANVWAPSVVQGRDGRFWMYVSVGNEIWVGVADHPAGPWRDANGGKPLVRRDFRPGFHMIDAEAFIDDDGQAYLYWGSGLNWVNGRCFAVKLKPDMTSFDGEVHDVTPPHYFEGPFMVKRNGRYFLTSSWGNTTKDNYQVRYAIGDTPFGPFREPEDKPLLATDQDRQIISPGHHAVFRVGQEDFILYHRQALPFPRAGDEVLRQVAVDRLRIAGDRLLPVIPTHEGPDIAGTASHRTAGRAVALTASSARDPLHAASAAGDDNYATGWQGDATAETSWLQADLGAAGQVGESHLRPADVMQTLHFSVEASDDGRAWQRIGAPIQAQGSPISIPAAGRARFVRLRFDGAPGILEWTFP